MLQVIQWGSVKIWDSCVHQRDGPWTQSEKFEVPASHFSPQQKHRLPFGAEKCQSCLISERAGARERAARDYDRKHTGFNCVLRWAAAFAVLISSRENKKKKATNLVLTGLLLLLEQSDCCMGLSVTDRQKDRWTEGQTDRRTEEIKMFLYYEWFPETPLQKKQEPADTSKPYTRILVFLSLWALS